MAETPGYLANVAELRRVFDQSFARPAQPPATDMEEFLAVRTAGRPLAFRVSELTEVADWRKVVPLPADTANLLGLAGIAGKLVPVYSLAGLLELGAAAGAGRWIAVCGRDQAIGLAFDSLERYLRVSRSAVLAVGTHALVQQAVHDTDEVRHVVNIASILATIRQRAGDPRSVAKEP